MARLSFASVMLALSVASAYETWHLVDLAAVICPKPSDAPQYAVGINYTSELQVDQPHIISILRKSSKAMKVTFKVLDGEGVEVIEEQTVQMGELSDSVPSTCTCQQPAAADHDALKSEYGANYGLSCDAWDEIKCDKWWGKDAVGPWCCQNWCYSSKDCPDAFESQLLPGTYYSYKACKGTAVSATCSWTSVAKSKDPCECKNKVASFNAAMKAKGFDTVMYGSKCSPWDSILSTCENFYRPDQVDTWCCASWCYVEKECPTAIASVNDGVELYWSDNVCIDDPKLMSQCKYKPQPNITAKTLGSCECLNETMPEALLPKWTLMPSGAADGVPSDYGSLCAPHDAYECNNIYPNAADHSMWCCMSWCWVSAECPGAVESTLWPGHYRSEAGCEMDDEIVSGCPFDRTSCECANPPNQSEMEAKLGVTKAADFPADYGSSCKAWDADGCKRVWGSDADSNWDSTSHDWCCDSWCYVSIDCPIAQNSWLTDLGLKYYFSYTTCDDDTSLNYQEPPVDNCAARRLRGPEELEEVDEDEEDEADQEKERRLSARRRGGSRSRYSSSSYSGSRRRAPRPSPRRRAPSGYSSAGSRRRQYSAPSGPSLRRRSPPPAPPPVRRRAPPPPVAQRRRTTAMGGQSQTYSSARRRAPTASTGTASSTSDTRRRRSSYDGNYGYTGRPQMMNNYGNQMPQQTSYGYSGYQAYPQKSHSNVAMYAAGGFVAGAAVGGLGGYAAASYFNSNQGYNRYHNSRYGSDYRESYCFVPNDASTYQSWDRAGDVISCRACRNRYGYCLNVESCQRASGCGYETPSSVNREDFQATGFIPKDYTPPLSVIFTKLEGDDIDPNPNTGGICPPTTEADKTKWETQGLEQRIPMDVFVVLTRQEKLSMAGKIESSCGSVRLPLLLLLFLFLVGLRR
eukprot:TRINITY_DN5417_c0_g3_i1.p1 TRINITY_DN5417_c0_g3~~TRINITY_DN5417_c0_g3_i1.p1  ORF type:complete len:915 (-),score=121.55 TRINITY_DN5417_c0_g3_i1:108-2852(-)